MGIYPWASLRASGFVGTSQQGLGGKLQAASVARSKWEEPGKRSSVKKPS